MKGRWLVYSEYFSPLHLGWRPLRFDYFRWRWWARYVVWATNYAPIFVIGGMSRARLMGRVTERTA